MSHRTMIIAEFGSNHMGSYHRAMEAPEVFADCGADAVKFQLFKLEDILHDPTQEDRLTELPTDWLPDIAKQCAKFDIEFMCTPFSEWAVEALNPYVKRWKIAAFEQKRRHVWSAVYKTAKPIIASFGRDKPFVADLQDRKLTPLYCVSKYPADDEDIFLRTPQKWGVPWGFSDHTRSAIIPALAVAMGATVIEKHVCLDYDHDGPDMPHSLDPEDFADMVGNIRLADQVCHANPPEKPLLISYPNRRE